MNSSSWNRWLALAGILFAILFVVGIFLATSIDSSESDANILKDAKDGTIQTATVIGAYLVAVSCIMLMAFASRLRAVLSAAEGGNGLLSRMSFLATGVLMAMLLAGIFAIAAVPGALVFGGAPDPTNADTVRFLPQMGFGAMLVGGGFSAIAMILPASIVTLRTGVLPAWFGWLGLVACIALLFGAFFIPMIALPIWVLIAGILLVGRSGEGAAVAA
jgi:hypothetical protein